MKMNVYKVTFFGRAPEQNGQPGKPKPVQAAIVGAVSDETARVAVMNAQDEAVEIEHIQNLYMGVNLVIDSDSLNEIAGPLLVAAKDAVDTKDAEVKALKAELAKFQMPQEPAPAVPEQPLSTEKIQ